MQFVVPDPFFGASTFNGSTVKPFSGPKLYRETNSPPITQAINNPFVSSGSHGSSYNWSQVNHYHAGSAPSDVPLKQNFGYFQESPVASSFTHTHFENVSRSYMGGLSDSSYFARPSPVFQGSANFAASNSEALAESGRLRRAEAGVQIDNKKQFHLDLDRIISGEDTRTTLMVKNIPNK